VTGIGLAVLPDAQWIYPVNRFSGDLRDKSWRRDALKSKKPSSPVAFGYESVTESKV
jgi:hypothetical protein